MSKTGPRRCVEGPTLGLVDLGRGKVFKVIDLLLNDAGFPRVKSCLFTICSFHLLHALFITAVIVMFATAFSCVCNSCDKNV